MIRSFLVVSLSLLYTFAVGGPYLIYSLLTGNTDRLYQAGVRGVRLALWLGGVRAEVQGREKLCARGAVVYMANHQSNCDPPAIVSLVPPVLILAKEEFFRVPILGRAMRLRGFIPIKRKNRQEAIGALERGTELLGAGHSFLVFPEGTRSPDGRLLPFKKGVFIMAIKAGVPIIPVSVSGSRKIMAKGRLAIRPGKVRVTLHEPVRTEREAVEEVQRRVREAILSGLDEGERPDGKTVMVIAKRYVISGRVQGVGFRFFAEREAALLGIRGYVRNLADGTVEAYAIGSPDSLDSFKGRLSEGPRAAEVTNVKEVDSAVNRRYSSFVVEA